jgi:LCP family protein required for cell wall assembly
VASPPDPPEYKVYRSRRKALGGLRPSADLQGLRDRLRRRRPPREPRERTGWTPGRVVKWAAIGIGGWLAFSLLIFLLSAQIEQGVSDQTKAALSSNGNFFTGATTLVLGSDQRGGDSIDKSQRGPARADSIMLLHTSFGSVHKLSIPRDAQAAIPGHGTTKINAAYALGGAPLMIRTVEGYFGGGVHINHIVEIDFVDFPKLIDSMGGITVDVPNKICSPPFDNFWKGLNFKPGRQHMDGKTALGYSRIRKNKCAPNETDLDRAKRQQQVFSAIRGKMISPTTFLRLPWVSWKAPKALKTDMHGPGLLGLAADMGTGGSGDTNVLDPSCLGCGVDGSLVVSEGAKRDALRKLLGK